MQSGDAAVRHAAVRRSVRSSRARGPMRVRDARAHVRVRGRSCVDLDAWVDRRAWRRALRRPRVVGTRFHFGPDARQRTAVSTSDGAPRGRVTAEREGREHSGDPTEGQRCARVGFTLEKSAKANGSGLWPRLGSSVVRNAGAPSSGLSGCTRVVTECSPATCVKWVDSSAASSADAVVRRFRRCADREAARARATPSRAGCPSSTPSSRSDCAAGTRDGRSARPCDRCARARARAGRPC